MIYSVPKTANSSYVHANFAIKADSDSEMQKSKTKKIS